MKQFRLSPQAETDLDEIWEWVAIQSGTAKIATAVVSQIVEHLWTLARFPHVGRKRDTDLRPGLRSFTAGDYLILYRMDKRRGVLVLRVLHGARDIPALFKDVRS